MKLQLTIVLTFFVFTRAYQQVVTVSNDKMNLLYKGISNPLTIVVEDYPCNKTIAKSDCGILKLLYDSCHYEFYADSSCSYLTTIQVGIIDSGKTKWIGSKPFRVKPIYDPTATYAGTTGGHIEKQKLLSGDKIIPVMKDWDAEIYFIVNNYSLSITRNDSLVTNETNLIGDKVSSNTKVYSELEKTVSNDIVLLYNISVTGPDKIIRILNEIKLIVK
jgi:hypothetical protein